MSSQNVSRGFDAPSFRQEIPPRIGGFSWYIPFILDRSQLVDRIKRALKRRVVVIDDIQRLPELLPVLRVLADRKPRRLASSSLVVPLLSFRANPPNRWPVALKLYRSPASVWPRSGRRLSIVVGRGAAFHCHSSRVRTMSVLRGREALCCYRDDGRVELDNSPAERASLARNARK